MRAMTTACVSAALAGMLLSGTALAQGITQVRYLNQETDPAVVAIQRAWVEDFVAKNPEIDIILEGAPNTVINQRIATYVQAGAPLDVVHADGGSAARLAAAGVLAPLDDVVDALGGREAFLPGRLLEMDGHVYSINQAAASPVLHYRKDLFEEAGLEPPSSWEELLHAAQTLHSDQIAGIALPGGENRATTIYAGVFLWQSCGDFFDRELNVTVDTPQSHEALAFYSQLLDHAPPDAAAWSFPEPIESFWSGRAAMVPYWHGLDLTMRQNPAMIENIGVVPMPEGRMRVTEQGGRYISVFAESPAVDESRAWVEYVFSPENARALSEIQPMLYPPATHAAVEALRASDAPTIQAYGDILFDVVYPGAEHAYNQIFDGGGINAETCTIDRTGVINPFVSVVWNSNLYARAVQRVAYDGASPEEAAAEAQKALEEQVEVARQELAN
jgi:ABC-type glycerol-3-phosphate transport system substrate-binding protein